MDNDKTCAAMICESRWYLPSLNKLVGLDENVLVADWPTDAQFIKNTAYRECGLPGEVWDNDVSSRIENEAGWLCAYHAHGDKSVLPNATLADLWDVGKTFGEWNAQNASRPVGASPLAKNACTAGGSNDESML